MGIGLFDSLGESEPVLNEGVEEELLIAFGLPVPFADWLDGFSCVGLELAFEGACLINICFSEELTEEEETNFVVKFKVDAWILLFDSSDLWDKFVNKESKGEFLSDYFGVFGWDEDGLRNLFLNDDLPVNRDDSLDGG